MRVGHNPARFVEKVAQPAGITVTVVNCIPFLSGYYEQSLDVLKLVVESLHATRAEAHPYDVMIFDNHSCAEVRGYLKEASQQGKIQYLIFSDTNIGKIGAWNFMFGAAQGKYVVYSDGDILFRPGWLQASLELFETYPNVGMVTARPYRGSEKYSTATFDWARKQATGVLEEGLFLDWETVWEHGRSIGVSEEQARSDYPNMIDHRLTYRGKTAYIGASHFQFMTRRDLLKSVIPFPSEQPMRGERALDIAFDEIKSLRLNTEKALVMHMGNRLPDSVQITMPVLKKTSMLRQLLWLPGIRHFLLWLNNQIFRLYFFNVK
ncbi:MAG: glycosyltransferase [Anaerolineales bacterium]|jgi:glycosyltransferase involved in cell wall biosynthesis